jgi:hypothetical protein
MSILLKPSGKFVTDQSRFELYNLRENPFPATPIVNQGDNDIRYNGEIFEQKIRGQEWSKLYDNFLKVPQADPNHLRIGYILDTSYVGRGNGKSTFSINLLKSINKAFCLDISNGVNKCFGLYLTPEPSGRTKTFYDVVDLLFDNICNSNVINTTLATLRLEAILELYKDFDPESFKSDDAAVDSLNTFDWFEKKGIEVASITNEIFRKAEFSQMPLTFPLNRDRNNYYGPRIVTSKDFRDYYNTLKKGKDRIDFVFTHMVDFLIGSGFNGAYVVIDDFERIPDFQSDRQKREFALELRTNIFDGMSRNAKVGFFNFILILHAGVPRLIEKSWSDTGMEQRSPITTASANSNHIIYFEKLSLEHTVLLISKYLTEYRIKAEKQPSILPFEKKAIHKIGEITELNAARILQKANHILEKAAEKKLQTINEQFVVSELGQPRKIEEASIKKISDETTIDLHKEAKKK